MSGDSIEWSPSALRGLSTDFKNASSEFAEKVNTFSGTNVDLPASAFGATDSSGEAATDYSDTLEQATEGLGNVVAYLEAIGLGLEETAENLDIYEDDSTPDGEG